MGAMFVQNIAASVPQVCRYKERGMVERQGIWQDFSMTSTVSPDKRLHAVESSLSVGKSALPSGAKMPLQRGKSATLAMFALAQTYIRLGSNVCSRIRKLKQYVRKGCEVAAGLRHSFGKHSRH